MIKKIASAVWAYLKDWRNLLSHSIVGVALVVIPLALPLPAWGRALAFVALVGLNTLRMTLSKRKKAAVSGIAAPGGTAAQASAPASGPATGEP
ncbi:MAG: hypothetical protein KKA67_06915 [Spirochaetes bacterium]|nr:hypothetical protein [Spirochaetota bacterium]MBU1081938.1 hypothetical protein [Spirochaetota bacterium]